MPGQIEGGGVVHGQGVRFGRIEPVAKGANEPAQEIIGATVTPVLNDIAQYLPEENLAAAPRARLPAKRDIRQA